MRSLALVLSVLLTLWAIVPASTHAQTPPSVAVRLTSTFRDILVPARDFNLVHGVSEFNAGEAGRANSSLGPRFFTVLEGNVTVQIGDRTRIFGAGQTWDVPGGIYFGIKNDGPERARVFFSVISPIGSPGPQPMPGSTPPAAPSRILHQVQTPVTVSTNTITIVQAVQDWPAGARNANHAMNQPHLYSMMEGENTSRFFDGHSERSTANQAGVMAVGQGGYMENSGASANRLFFTWAATPGEPNTVPATPPQPASGPAASENASSAAPASTRMTAPSAGDGGLLEEEWAAESKRFHPEITVLVAVLALLAGRWALIRSAGRK